MRLPARALRCTSTSDAALCVWQRFCLIKRELVWPRSRRPVGFSGKTSMALLSSTCGAVREGSARGFAMVCTHCDRSGSAGRLGRGLDCRSTYTPSEPSLASAWPRGAEAGFLVIRDTLPCVVGVARRARAVSAALACASNVCRARHVYVYRSSAPGNRGGLVCECAKNILPRLERVAWRWLSPARTNALTWGFFRDPH